MDNITHSLAGFLAAEGLVRMQTARGRAVSPAAIRWTWGISFLANNFPDLDILYARRLSGELGYLLHHRGHTHTLIGILPQGAFIFGLVWFLARWGRAKSQTDWKLFASAAFLGPILHLSMDALNSYGVHPFWPFLNDWFYGDTLFIVEPWFWVLLTPPLFFLSPLRWLKGFFLLVFGAAIFLGWTSGFVSVPLCATLVIGGVTTGFLCWKLNRASLLPLALALSLGVLVIFAGAGQYARLQLQRRMGSSLRDLALTPLPANPFCWNFISVEIDATGENYRMTRGLFSILPAIGCAEIFGAGTVIKTPVHELKKWSEQCEVAAFLRFARTPYFFKKGESWVVSDLRFDRGKGSFAQLLFTTPPAECPSHVPDWVPPINKSIFRRE